MATKDVKAKVKKPKVKADAPVKEKETLEDRLTLAYYMLAGVVDKNTQCMAALLTALEMAAETQAQNATHLKVVPPPQEPIPIKSVIDPVDEVDKLHVYTVSECQKVLLGVGGAKGKETAFKLLKKYGAERISELSPADFHLFVEDGNKIIEGEL